jgi:hypothetical protein
LLSPLSVDSFTFAPAGISWRALSFALDLDLDLDLDLAAGIASAAAPVSPPFAG